MKVIVFVSFFKKRRTVEPALEHGHLSESEHGQFVNKACFSVPFELLRMKSLL